MNREEKIKKVQKIIFEMINVYDAAKQIIDAIDPPKIEVGMWGKFWDTPSYIPAFGRLEDVDGEFYFLGDKDFKFFKPLPGLKEAIEKLEKDDQ